MSFIGYFEKLEAVRCERGVEECVNSEEEWEPHCGGADGDNMDDF